jgi:hypothetical protein
MKLDRGIRLALCALGVAALGLSGCGNSSGKGSGSGYSIANCPNSTLPAACVTCLTSSCSSLVSAIDTACSDFLACACPLGEDAGVCYASTACQAAPASVSCSSCGDVCPTGLGAALLGYASSGGSGSSSGSSGGSSGSSSGASSSGGSSGSSGSSGGSSDTDAGGADAGTSDAGAADAATDAALVVLTGI